MPLIVTLIMVGLFLQAGNRPNPSQQPQCQSDGSLVFCRDTQTAYSTRSITQEVIAIDLRNRQVEWHVDVPDSVYSNLVATGSVVVFACGLDDICAVSRTTGKQVWKVGERSRQLAVVGDYVIAQSALLYDFIALEAKSGQIVWRHRSRRGQGPYPGFFAVSGTVILASSFSFDGGTGRVLTRWPSLNDTGVTAAAFAGDLQVIAQATRVAAYRLDSSQAWEAELPVEGFDQPKVVYLRGSKEGVIAGVGETKSNKLKGLLRLIRLSSTGSVVWRRDIPDIDVMVRRPHGPMSLVDGRVVVVTRQPDALTSGIWTIRSFDFENGSPGWTTPARASFDSTDLVTFDRGMAYLVAGIAPGWRAVMTLDVRDGRLESLMKFSQ